MAGDELVAADAAGLVELAQAAGATPDRISQLCIELASVTGAGLSVMTAAGNTGTVYTSDDVSARIEELQFTLGEGPCTDAFATGDPIFVADLLDPAEGVAQRWPGFLDAAAEAGVRAVFAFPLRIGVITVGVMDLYRDEPGPLGTGQLTAALLAADAAARSLLDLDEATPGGLVDAAGERSAYRLEVHQATGMIKVQLRSSMADALMTLRAYAFAEDRSINDIAVDVIARRLRFPMED
jgi:GAF domain